MTKLTKLAAFAVTSISSFALATAPVAAATYYNTTTTGPANAAFSLAFMLCICVFAVLIVGLKIYLIVDAVNRDYGDDQSMLLIGILFLLFLGFPIGDILYWALIMQKYPKKQK
jgi:hypothetical protein